MNESAFVLIVEDHPLYKQALVSLMKLSFPEIRIVGSGSAEDARQFVQQQSPEVVSQSLMLLDLSLPGLSGLQVVDMVQSEFPNLQLVVVSGSDDPLRVGACLGAGVKAFVSKTSPPDLIVELIGRALRGELKEQEWLSQDGRKPLEGLHRVHLTSRQLQVLSLLCQGKNNREIGEELQIIEATAKAHVSAIFKELGVVSRTQALLAAQRLGLKEQA